MLQTIIAMIPTNMVNHVAAPDKKRFFVITKERFPWVSTALTLMPMCLRVGQELMRTVKAVPRESVARRMSSSFASVFSRVNG